MKKVFMIIFVLSMTLIVSCKKNMQRPYGALDIEYNIVEEANSEGPSVNDVHVENAPPLGDVDDKIIEIGPAQIDETSLVEPRAERELNPDYGGIPIVTGERNS